MQIMKSFTVRLILGETNFCTIEIGCLVQPVDHLLLGYRAGSYNCDLGFHVIVFLRQNKISGSEHLLKPQNRFYHPVPCIHPQEYALWCLSEY